jgi:hypothetical protein
MALRNRPWSLLSAVGTVTILCLSGCSLLDGGGSSCEAWPKGLAPPGSGPDAYTMILRVNTEADLEALSSGQLGSEIRDRDILLVNTEYRRMKPEEARKVFDRAREEFPCNRIASLNGLNSKKDRPGYLFALSDEPKLDAVIIDWERSTWEETGKVPWSNSLKENVTRAGRELDRLSRRIVAQPGEPRTRVGLATEYRTGWDYAELGRQLALVNSELRQGLLGYQLIQSQNRCGGTRKAASIAAVSEELQTQYGKLAREAPDAAAPGQSPAIGREVLNHLGFEISFSVDPKAGSGLAVTRDSPQDAARCSRDVLRTGSGAIIYWATPQAVGKMLSTPVGRELGRG